MSAISIDSRPGECG